MMRTMRMMLLLTVFAAAAKVQAYPVGPPMPVSEVAGKSDVIVKVKAIKSVKAGDVWLKDLSDQGYAVMETRFEIISVIKGQVSEKEFVFRHYDNDPDGKMIGAYMPQMYHFDAGRTYLVFAAKDDQAGVYRQLWTNHTGAEDLGVWRCADEKAVAADTKPVDAVWRALVAMAGSKDDADVMYAIEHLNRMSAGNARFSGTNDFKSEDVLKIVLPLLKDPRPAVAGAVIGMLGRESPLIQQSPSIWWVAMKAKNGFIKRGIGVPDPPPTNALASRFIPELVGAADAAKAPAMRAKALAALALLDDPMIAEKRPAWTEDSAAEVRAAVCALWAQTPGDESDGALKKLAGDKEKSVRIAALYAIAYTQREGLLPVAEEALGDADAQVGSAASLAVLSYELRVAKEIWQRHTADKRYKPLFAAALAQAEPEKHRDELVAALKEKVEPEYYFGGEVPLYTVWELLMDEMENVDTDDLRSGKMDTYLDALEEPPNIGSGPYQRLYQLYHDRGMPSRAKEFREKAAKRVTYDLNVYFDRIDGK